LRLSVTYALCVFLPEDFLIPNFPKGGENLAGFVSFVGHTQSWDYGDGFLEC